MNREFYRDIVVKMLINIDIDNYIIENIVDKCVKIDKLVQLGNESTNHHLRSPQVIALIVYEYLQGF